MDDVTRTLADYEGDAERYTEKYLRESIADRYGDGFRDVLDGNRVLDAGCGPGADSATFADAGYDVVGVDITPSFLRAATDHAPSGAFVRGDMRRLPLADRTVDGVWASASLLHVPRADVPATLDEFARVLRSDGAFYASVKRHEREGADPGDRHFEYYDPAELRELVAASPLTTRRVRTQENWVQVLARR